MAVIAHWICWSFGGTWGGFLLSPEARTRAPVQRRGTQNPRMSRRQSLYGAESWIEQTAGQGKGKSDSSAQKEPGQRDLENPSRREQGAPKSRSRKAGLGLAHWNLGQGQESFCWSLRAHFHTVQIIPARLASRQDARFPHPPRQGMRWNEIEAHAEDKTVIAQDGIHPQAKELPCGGGSACY